MAPSDLVEVFRTYSDVEANIVRSLLDAHGIQSLVAAETRHAISPLTADGMGEVRVCVRETDAVEARRIIEAQSGDTGLGPLLTTPVPLEEVERRLGYRFKDRDLLECALTHRSRTNEDATGAVSDNESLEFLGDSVLGFIVAELLFRQFPHLDEGGKSKIKASLVSTATLARLARRIDLGSFLVLGRGEEKTGGRKKHALLANAFEALLAALYLDGGLEVARSFVERQLSDVLEEARKPEAYDRDPKSALQEWLQAREQEVPEYRVRAERGPAHQKRFEVDLLIDGAVVATGEGRSKKAAEQAAARLALERLAGPLR